MEHWKISDFAKLINKHNNTVNGWFRELESTRKIHYVSRVNNEKVYDALDLEIAQFIVRRRDNNWALDAIFEDLPNHFDLRPFPKESQDSFDTNEMVDINDLKMAFRNEMETTLKELVDLKFAEQKEVVQNLLPSPEEERLNRLNSIMAERKVSRKLEKEALELWNQKPLEKRTIKVGWFRRKEDINKREFFIKEYIDQHFESSLKKEFGFSDL